MNKNAEYYRGLPYTIELWRTPDEGGWVVQVKELPGCVSKGETAEEAIAMIQDAMQGWLEVALEMGDAIPEPRPEEEYSGKFVVRVPRSLHRKLVEMADREGVSLNQYINVTLAHATGQPAQATSKREAPPLEPAWPGLKASVRQVLLAAGCRDDAGELDEQIFANWADQMIGQVTAAAEDGDVREAHRYLQAIQDALKAGARRSPALASLARLAALLTEQLETTHRLQQGILSQFGLDRRIAGVVQSANQELAMAFVREERAAYSADSTGATTTKGLMRSQLRIVRSETGPIPKTGTGW